MKQDIEKNLFINVYGYEDVKNELKLIRSWLTDEELISNPNIMIPRGVLFYGVPGCGKTLLLREFANSFGSPIYVIEGKEENIANEIIETFKKAREEKFAVVCIDEIDLLLKDKPSLRAIQQELDGIDQKGSLVVLATTNHFEDLPKSLLRPGRFDKHIEISYPDKESRKEIFKKFIGELGLSLENIDFDHVAKVCSRCNGASIKAVCNDAYLRCKKDINTKEIEISYRRVCKGYFEDKSLCFKDKRVAVHEAGHSLMTLHFNKNWSFYNARFTETGGYTELQENDERVDTIEKRTEHIMIGLSGYLAEEVCFGNHDIGSYSDLSRCLNLADRLIERSFIKGVNNLVPDYYYMDGDKHWSDTKIKKNEKLSQKLLRKYIRRTKKWLKKHKAQILAFADAMYEKGEITYREASLITGL